MLFSLFQFSLHHLFYLMLLMQDSAIVSCHSLRELVQDLVNACCHYLLVFVKAVAIRPYFALVAILLRAAKYKYVNFRKSNKFTSTTSFNFLAVFGRPRFRIVTDAR